MQASGTLVGTDYVKVEPELRLPALLQPVEDKVRAFDPDLRLRMARKQQLRDIGCGYILERRIRRGTKPVHTETKKDGAGTLVRKADPDVQVASRDGYIIVSPVHFTLMGRPDAIIERLKDGDHATTSGAARLNAHVEGQIDGQAKRKAFRHAEATDFYRESFHTLKRMNNGLGHQSGRLRMNNAGGEERLNIMRPTVDRRRIKPEDVGLGTSAGVTPAKESSDVHSARAAGCP